MVGWLSPDLIPPKLSPHIHPCTPPISSDIPKYPRNTPKHHSRHPHTKKTPADTKRHCKTSSKIQDNPQTILNTPQTPLRNSERLSGAPKIVGLSGRCPMIVRSVVGLSGAVFRDVLRCIKVLDCAQGGI